MRFGKPIDERRSSLHPGCGGMLTVACRGTATASADWRYYDAEGRRLA